MLSGLVDAIGVSGKLGIIVAKNQKGEIVVERLVPGGPAAKDATMKSGDVILQIDGKAVASNTNAVADQLVGPKGSEAVIKIKQIGLLGSAVREVKLTRGEYADPNLSASPEPQQTPPIATKTTTKESPSPSSLFGFMSPAGPSENQVNPGQKPQGQPGSGGSGSWNLFGAALGLQTAGVGIKLGQKGTKVIVAELMAGGPAQKSGKVSQGDVLVAVDNTSVAASTMDAVGWRLSGAKGSEVKLKLLRTGLFGEETVEVALVRDDTVSAGNAADEETKRAEAKNKADKQRQAEEQSGLSEKKKKEGDGGWDLFGRIGSAAATLGLPTCGVGVMLQVKGKAVIVDQVIRGGPADKSGRVSKGDQIMAVNDESAEGCSSEWVGLRLTGQKGSDVKVKLLRAGLMGEEYIYVTLKRAEAPAAGAAEAQKRADSQKKADEQRKREREKEQEQKRAEEAKKAEAERKAKGGDDWNLFSFVGDAASAVGLPTSGIGVVLGQKGKQVVVAEVMRGGPADKSGRVSKGDQIMAVNDESMEGCSTEWVGLKLGGPKGSEVKLKLLRDGLMGHENVYVTMKRNDPPADGAAEAQKRADSQKKADEQRKREREKEQEQKRAEEAKKAEAERKAKGGDDWNLFSFVGDAASAVGLPTSGVGLKLAQKGKQVVVAEVMRGGAADKSGRVSKGDVVKEVNGEATDESSAESVAWKLSGSKGSDVKVKLLRSGLMGSENVYLTLKRDDTPPPQVKPAAAPQKQPQPKTAEAGPKKEGAKKEEGGGGWDLFSLAGSALGLPTAGVGIKLGKQGKSVVVGELLPGGPAAKSGKVTAGDQILAVDGVAVDGGDLEAVGKRLAGPKGSEVKLRLRKVGFFGAETADAVLTRDESVAARNQEGKSREKSARDPQKEKGKAGASNGAEGEGGSWDVMSLIQEATGQRTAGIGVALKQHNDAVVVAAVARGAVAQRTSKVQVNDTIVEVDGQRVSDCDAASRQLAGLPGSEIKLKLRRPGVLGPETLDVSLLRERIVVKPKS